MVGIKPDGQPDRRSVSGRSRAECRRKLQELGQQHDQGALPTHDRSGITVAACIERWLAAVAASVRPATLGSKRLDALRRSDVQALLAYLPTKPARGKPGRFSPRTVRHVDVMLNTALEAAIKRGKARRPGCTVVDPPRVSTAETSTPTPEACVRWLDSADGEPRSPLVARAVSPGARQGERLGLPLPDLAWQTGTLHSRRSPSTLTRLTTGPSSGPPKTKRSRRAVTLPPAALAALRLQQRRHLEQRLALRPASKTRFKSA